MVIRVTVCLRGQLVPPGCTLYNVQYTVYSVQCTVYIVQCTAYSLGCGKARLTIESRVRSKRRRQFQHSPSSPLLHLSTPLPLFPSLHVLLLSRLSSHYSDSPTLPPFFVLIPHFPLPLLFLLSQLTPATYTRIHTYIHTYTHPHTRTHRQRDRVNPEDN